MIQSLACTIFAFSSINMIPEQLRFVCSCAEDGVLVILWASGAKVEAGDG
jgi:hypothetical protein